MSREVLAGIFARLGIGVIVGISIIPANTSLDT